MLVFGDTAVRIPRYHCNRRHLANHRDRDDSLEPRLSSMRQEEEARLLRFVRLKPRWLLAAVHVSNVSLARINHHRRRHLSIPLNGTSPQCCGVNGTVFQRSRRQSGPHFALLLSRRAVFLPDTVHQQEAIFVVVHHRATHLSNQPRVLYQTS